MSPPEAGMMGSNPGVSSHLPVIWGMEHYADQLPAGR